MTINKQGWTKNQKKVFNWLAEWVNNDEKIVASLVGGGSYEYGTGIKEVDRDMYDNDEDYREYIDSQKPNWIEDVDLPGSGWWLVGSMI